MNTLFVLLLLVAVVGLVVGLAKPSLVKQESRKKAGLIFGGVTIALFILVGITSPSKPEQQTAPSETTTANEVSAPVDSINQNPAAPEKSASPATTQTQNKTTTTNTQQTAPATTAPIQVKQTDSQNAAPISTETVSQINAVKKAKSYLGYTAFSHDGLVAQLEYDQFSHADAVYGADNSGANWNEQAAAKAKSYMGYSAFSRGSLIAQLEYDKYTQAQAEYGANAVGL